jgi:two-component system, OmpR family, sensor histidine kinase TctE
VSAQSSIRRRLIFPIIASLIAFFAIDAVFLYRDTLASINVAYDRTLLASARAIGDGVKYVHQQVTVALPYPALEVFEADTRSRMVYRVGDFDGTFVSGYADLPPFKGNIVSASPYAALVTFYEDQFQGETVRVAALLQPVNVGDEYKMATVQVAETLELRRQVALQAIWQSLYRQFAMLILLTAAAWLIVGRGLRPLQRLREEIRSRSPESLDPVAAKTSREVSPVVEALNEAMSRLRTLLDNRQRFIRDASHQLRTPLAALKVQVQNAREGLVEPYVALSEIETSVDRATRVANQMLALAKVAELGEDENHSESERVSTDLVAVCRDIAVECSPLLTEKHLDFSLDGDSDTAQPVRGSDWMLREMLRNLLSNAIRYSPEGGAVGFVLEHDAEERRLYVWDSGPGIDAQQRPKLFHAFATGDRTTGTGLGLVICQDICKKIGATLTLSNRSDITQAYLPVTATGCVARIVFPV